MQIQVVIWQELSQIADGYFDAIKDGRDCLCNYYGNYFEAEYEIGDF